MPGIETCKAGSTSGDCCKGKKCAEGEGDCDSDSECADGLLCGTDICGAGFPSSTYDCCVKKGNVDFLHQANLSLLCDLPKLSDLIVNSNCQI